ncbi:hypothetical protein [Nocardioides sp.]|uniref:hypothetical protein n=1 Tax=Nocardioides sp. TaxID=35761 RepID=UPI002723F5A5|nr:hypothetical protein [Nocardioides sp.]MDO9458181.1 hypothetical protein [Nocardioides sp.]
MTNIEIEKIPATWCRMWNEDASLAHDLITDDGRWWSGKSDIADGFVGPDDTGAFVQTYQRDVGNLFTPRTLVLDGADRLAYTWDVTLRDGTVLTGADVCVLRDGKVVLNWTLPADRRDETPDPPTGRGSATRDEIGELVRGWCARWQDVADDDAVFWGPTDRRRDESVELHGDPVVDVAGQSVALTWSAGGVGGIDVLVLDGGRVGRAWSFGGQRPHLL